MSIIEDCDAKIGNQEIPKMLKPRDTQNNRQVFLGVENEVGQWLIEFCQGTCWSYMRHLPTTQETTLHADITVATAKSLQLCDPIDGSPPGSPVPGILQARTLEWVAISFSKYAV